jgi:hypothetical protein
MLFVATLFALAALAFKLGESLFVGRGAREPAALHRVLMDYSNLTDERFIQKVREHILNTVRFERKANSIVLSAGHFLGPFRAVSACNTFSHIDYELTAEGVAVSGEPPLMQITAECEPTNDQESLEPTDIDIRKLVSMGTKDQNINLSGGILIQTHNFPDEWPNEWILTRVRLRGKNEAIEISKEDLRQISLTARTIRW